MAPIRPRTTAKSAALKRPVAQAEATGLANSDFHSSKKDKRIIKHSAFVSKIEKSRKRPLKRRRPSKKLVTNLDSLADALPDAGDEAPTSSQVNVIRHKSLKHRPGAMKRKEKLDKAERDRFAKNMAQMATGLQSPAPLAAFAGAQEPKQSMSSNRWAALRSFISQTIDQNPEFKR